jgi:putative hydrolase of the HAD superfamily
MIARSMKTDPVKTRLLVEKRLYQNWESDFRYLKPYPHVKSLIEELKNRGDLKLGVLSDFPVQNKISFLGLENYWDTAFSSEEVNYLKPRPEPFLALADRLGLAPEEILYVGNSARYDIKGAAGVGMKTAYLGPAEKDPGADFRFSDYRQLRNYIFSLLQG